MNAQWLLVQHKSNAKGAYGRKEVVVVVVLCGGGRSKPVTLGASTVCTASYSRGAGSQVGFFLLTRLFFS